MGQDRLVAVVAHDARKRKQLERVLERDRFERHRGEKGGRARFGRLLRRAAGGRERHFALFRHVGDVRAETPRFGQHLAPGFGVHPQFAPVEAAFVEQLAGLGQGQLVGGDGIGDGGVASFRALALLLDVRPVAAHAQNHALAEVDRVDGLRVDVPQALDLPFEAEPPLLAFPKTREVFDPPLFAGCDAVELGLHVGREVVIDQLGKILLQQAHNRKGRPRGHERLAAAVDVPAVGDGRDRGGVCGRAPDPKLLHALDERGLGVARRRQGLVAVRGRLERAQGLPLLDLRQARVLAVLVPLRVGRLLVNGHEAGEGDDRSRRRKRRLARSGGPGDADVDADGGGLAAGVGHLRGHRAFPDELVERELAGRQIALDLGGRAEMVAGGPDRLVGLLRALGLRRVQPWLVRQRLLPVHLPNLASGSRNRLFGKVGRVGSHVRDVAVFVERLGRAHGVARAHAELAGGLLLEGRRRERRGRPAGVRLRLDGGDRRVRAFEGRGELFGVVLAEGPHAFLGGLGGEFSGVVEVPARGDAHGVEGCELGRKVLLLLGENRRHVPVGGGDEGHALAFARDDQPRGHRLHSPGREPGRDLAPQEGRDLVAHEAVEDAARFLGVHQLRIELAGIVERPGDGLRRDLVEHHALDRDLRLEHLVQMPGDGLAFAVLVGCEQQFVGLFEQLFQLGDLLLLVGVDHVVGLEARFDVHGELRVGALFHRRGQLGGLGEVANMADGGLYGVVRSEIAADGASLRWRLHDHKFAHAVSFRTTEGLLAPP